MRILSLGLLGLMLSGPIASAEPKQSEIAGWLVSVEKDPFGSDDRVVVAKLVDGMVIGFRCFNHAPQIALVEASPFRAGSLKPGDLYSVKLRIDERPIVLGTAQAVSSDVLQVEASDDSVYRAAQVGKELAIRVERSGRYSDFRLSLKGAARAMKDFYRICGIVPDAK